MAFGFIINFMVILNSWSQMQIKSRHMEKVFLLFQLLDIETHTKKVYAVHFKFRSSHFLVGAMNDVFGATESNKRNPLCFL